MPNRKMLSKPTTPKPATTRPMVTVESVNVPGYTHRVDAARYAAMKAALLKAVPAKPPGVTQTEMRVAVLPHLSETDFPGGGKVAWWAKTVQLDLEAKGILLRDRAAKPLRWHQTTRRR